MKNCIFDYNETISLNYFPMKFIVKLLILCAFNVIERCFDRELAIGNIDFYLPMNTIYYETKRFSALTCKEFKIFHSKLIFFTEPKKDS